ncbi:M15 family metallopeptidase [Streptomyces sp. NPDC051940]|uniref:M15 family metallopeptidase n=1 Tax=Streptomyces sp. NPDC051940 TaxID=3155675 RepID=UPI0034202085
MTRRPRSARTTVRRTPALLVVGLMVATAVISAVITTALGRSSQDPSASPSTAPPPPSSAAPSPSSAGPSPSKAARREQPGGLGEAGGALPDGVTVFDDGYPAVARLDADLLRALRAAATDATADGVRFYVNSGWRSPEYQDQLLREAVDKYGSEAEAARWVATPETSPHVAGDAVDVGRSNATTWLAEHGAAYGLCQIYRNEPWHYELRADAADRGCPSMYTDPTKDPRMQQ